MLRHFPLSAPLVQSLLDNLELFSSFIKQLYKKDRYITFSNPFCLDDTESMAVCSNVGEGDTMQECPTVGSR